TSRGQVLSWSVFFVIFVAVCSLTAWLASRGGSRDSKTATGAEATIPAAPVREKLLWLSLSACGSVLLLSFTNHITENVAPVPLLWVVRLALYLLSFTLAFH